MRVYDISLRFKYAGVNIDLITDNMREAIERALKTDAEVCYVLVNYSALFSTQNIMLDIKKEQENGGEQNER